MCCALSRQVQSWLFTASCHLYPYHHSQSSLGHPFTQTLYRGYPPFFSALLTFNISYEYYILQTLFQLLLFDSKHIIRFSIKLHRYSHVSTIEYSASCCRATSLTRRIFIIFEEIPNIHCYVKVYRAFLWFSGHFPINTFCLICRRYLSPFQFSLPLLPHFSRKIFILPSHIPLPFLSRICSLFTWIEQLLAQPSDSIDLALNSSSKITVYKSVFMYCFV